MSILCLTTEFGHQRNLYRLWYNYSFDNFHLLNETISGKSLIDTGTTGLYKKSKKEHSPELLHFTSEVRLDRLFELTLLRDRMWSIGKRITVKARMAKIVKETINLNPDLSGMDKRFIGEQYPKV